MPTFENVPASRTRIMRANKRVGTGPEMALRSELHRRGLRFRVDYPVRVPGQRLIRVDVAFTKVRLAVFLDGCFWHGCPQHATAPVENSNYWGPKLKENRARDARQTAALEGDGWRVMRLWEHVPVEEAADDVVALLSSAARSANAVRASRRA